MKICHIGKEVGLEKNRFGKMSSLGKCLRKRRLLEKSRRAQIIFYYFATEVMEYVKNYYKVTAKSLWLWDRHPGSGNNRSSRGQMFREIGIRSQDPAANQQCPHRLPHGRGPYSCLGTRWITQVPNLLLKFTLLLHMLFVFYYDYEINETVKFVFFI